MSKELRTLIVGAGSAGKTICRELVQSDLVSNLPICFVDDDPKKLGSAFLGIKVIGNINQIPQIVAEYKIQEILICMPSVGQSVLKRIHEICKQTDCSIKILPGVYQFINDGTLTPKLRDIDISDLLGRKPINVLTKSIKKYYSNKVVLVTGGGGSIGSEICRQLARLNTKKIIILDIYENCAYDVLQELKIKYQNKIDISVEIISICNRPALERVFAKYKPDIVIMAAAHKHVPLMENNVIEAVENNVFGTLNTVELAEKYGAERVHMVSTDKAVNPTSIMGATKRICEMIIQSHSQIDQKTTFSATRFGNVLGSAGSVIPLFKKQIANGGPVTVTDFRIIRYFMTIPEASGLVLESVSMAKNGELFVLDMGEPVKVYDLAKNMIRLSGYTLDKDIKIVETGLRPGEKLYEELLIKTEELDKTENSLIFIERDKPLPIKEVNDIMNKLRDAVALGDEDNARQLIIDVVPTFIR